MTAQFLPSAPAPGEIVRVRQRQYLVEDVQPPPEPGEATLVSMSCLDDDAQGEALEVLWESENPNALLDKHPEIQRSFFENETRVFLSVPELRERLPVQDPFLRRDELGAFCGILVGSACRTLVAHVGCMLGED